MSGRSSSQDEPFTTEPVKLLTAARRWTGTAVRAATLFLFVVHFGLTIIYVGPVNPIKMAFQPLIQATLATYFPQNWSLFAPNPVESDLSLLVRPLTRAEATRAILQGPPLDGWYDITTPLWRRWQQNRFSAYDRLSRPQSNGIRTFLYGNWELGPWWQACHKGDTEACAFFDTQLRSNRAQAQRLLLRLASSFCEEALNQCTGVDYLALRVRETGPIPWSQRYASAERPEHEVDLGIYAVIRGVAPAGLYGTGRNP